MGLRASDAEIGHDGCAGAALVQRLEVDRRRDIQLPVDRDSRTWFSQASRFDTWSRAKLDQANVVRGFLFGYHEVFHALTIVALACQYVAIAFFVVRVG
ncbi:MAG: hypothetical protein ACJ77E_16265 [Gaiellaceae bacterium]